MFEVKYKKLVNVAIICSALFLSNESFAGRGDKERKDSKNSITVAPKFSQNEDVNSQSSKGKNKEIQRVKVSIYNLGKDDDSMSKNLQSLFYNNENGRD